MNCPRKLSASTSFLGVMRSIRGVLGVLGVMKSIRDILGALGVMRSILGVLGVMGALGVCGIVVSLAITTSRINTKSLAQQSTRCFESSTAGAAELATIIDSDFRQQDDKQLLINHTTAWPISSKGCPTASARIRVAKG